MIIRVGAVTDRRSGRWPAMNALDQISLVFVGVCAVGIAYLVFVEPLRQWLHELRNKRKRTKASKH